MDKFSCNSGNLENLLEPIGGGAARSGAMEFWGEGSSLNGVFLDTNSPGLINSVYRVNSFASHFITSTSLDLASCFCKKGYAPENTFRVSILTPGSYIFPIYYYLPSCTKSGVSVTPAWVNFCFYGAGGGGGRPAAGANAGAGGGGGGQAAGGRVRTDCTFTIGAGGAGGRVGGENGGAGGNSSIKDNTGRTLLILYGGKGGEATYPSTGGLGGSDPLCVLSIEYISFLSFVSGGRGGRGGLSKTDTYGNGEAGQDSSSISFSTPGASLTFPGGTGGTGIPWRSSYSAGRPGRRGGGGGGGSPTTSYGYTPGAKTGGAGGGGGARDGSWGVHDGVGGDGGAGGILFYY